MGRNLKNERSNNKPASDSTPGGMKTYGPMSKVKNISGPSIKSDPQGPRGAPYMDKGEAQSK